MVLSVTATRQGREIGFFQIDYTKAAWRTSYPLVLQSIIWGSDGDAGVKTYIDNPVWSPHRGGKPRPPWR